MPEEWPFEEVDPLASPEPEPEPERIASLILMLGTVAKVFLFDANGLDGLLRVASFAALGFSLIGLGWLYSHYLPDPAANTIGRDPPCR